LDGFEASGEPAPASPFAEGEEEEEEVEEVEELEEVKDELCVPRLPLPEARRPFRDGVCPCWPRTTDENGAPARWACECPDATLPANVIAPAASESATASRKRVCAPKRRRRRLKLATDAPSAAMAGIREGSGMRRV
jgi:hypothetical protein